MALICDPDYLIHNLRLNYLRNVDDPYGPRLITFDPRYQTNAHVIASGAADPERWPELRMPQSPQVSDDESGAPSGRRAHPRYPGATGLKHTQTIMGPSRVGVMGMRVSGRRAVTGKTPVQRRSISAASATPRRLRADSEPTPMAAASSSPNKGGAPGSRDTYDESLIQVSKRRSAGGTSLSEIATSLAERVETEDAVSEDQLLNAPAALQSMSHIAAMQARRQRRRAHFSSAGDNAARPIIVSETKLDAEESSDEEGGDMMSGSVDDDFIVEVEGSLENDSFDPDFAPPHIRASDNSSDLIHSNSNSALSTSMSSINHSSLQIGNGPRGRNRLSPVSETRPSEYALAAANSIEKTEVNGKGHLADSSTGGDPGAPIDSYFEMVEPPEPVVKRKETKKNVSKDRAAAAVKNLTNGKNTQHTSSEEPLFVRRKVPPIRSQTSALTAKLASSNTSTNPFTELYALISGRAEVASMEVTVFFPHAQEPANKPLNLTVRKDATIEEVVGFALWSYWEEGWLPKLDGDSSEEQKKIKLSAAGWVLRVAEDDGEVDEDWPAPDRMARISKFNFDAYAILEASSSQVTQNQQLEAKIVRRPSRIIVSKKKQEPSVSAPSLLLQSVSGLPNTMGTSVDLLSSSLNISSSHGSQVLLRIRMADVDDTAVHYSTTISVFSTMYMQEVLEKVCHKRKLDNPKDWALLSDDFKILVPLDRTVASLEGSSQLVLVQRSSLPHYGFATDGDRRTARTVDPNASIFKRISEVQPKNKVTDVDFNVYKRYTVHRKLPMLVTRTERTLAIDGDYIHIMPSTNKARGVFDSGKTNSYNIKSVSKCSQSGSSFKIIFKRDMGEKRYEFEAENSRTAAEIVATIRGLRWRNGGLERSGTVSKARRSSRIVT